MSALSWVDLEAIALTSPPRDVCACGRHGIYPTRREARKARRRLHPGEHKRPYPCRGNWHLGGLPDFVRSAPRGDLRVVPPRAVLVGIAAVASTIEEHP